MIKSLTHLHKRGTRKVLDHVYYEMIALAVMYKEYEFSDDAAQYAKKVIAQSAFSTHRINAPDLYNLFVYFTRISEFDINKKDSILLKRTVLDINEYVRILRKMATGALRIVELDMFLKRIGTQLYVEDNILRSLGRMSINWNRLTLKQKKLSVAKMEKYGTINFRFSQIIKKVRSLNNSIVLDQDTEKKPFTKSEREPYPTEKIDVPRSKGSDVGKLALGAIGGFALSKFLNRSKSVKDPFAAKWKKGLDHKGFDDLRR